MQTTVANALVLLAALMLQPYESAQAKGFHKLGDQGDQFSMDINMSGTVVANGSCTFNQGGTVDVDFGDVKYRSTADGDVLDEEYSKVLVSDMTCSGDTEGTSIMTLDGGTYTHYNGHTVLSVKAGGKVSDLVIELEVDGAVKDIGSAFTVDLQKPPVLVAKLIKIGNDSLPNDVTLNSSATLTMAFN